MAAAREAGATGGTVINARGNAHQGPVKFFGISVQDEKEIIIILSTRERKAPIMQAVSQAFGISSKAGGIIFSLPVDGVAGLDLK
jgi:nitrogen regulatory protein PII